MPDIIFPNILSVSGHYLDKAGIEGLILDVDNTLRVYGQWEPFEGVREWTRSLEAEGMKIIIVSNNFPSRIGPFAAKMELDYIAMGLKPSPWGLLRACKKIGTRPKKTAIIGDQVFTDIIGGNLLGMHTILVSPLKNEDKFIYNIKRTLESGVYKKYNKRNGDNVL